MDYPLDRILKRFTVRDLPLNRRQQLCSYLNSEQVLESESGFARDFRGIAQQLELNYAEIVKLEKLIDPFGGLLNFQTACRLDLFELFRMIERIERFDILDDILPLLQEDIDKNIIDNQHREQKVVSYDPSISAVMYDAYVCYADSDLEFVRSLTSYLESSCGLRLFLRDRDLLGGHWVYETFAQLIESQCRRVVIILSPDFLSCPDCAFQSQFATSLAIEKRARILIPVIYKPCQLPAMIRLLSKIDMSSSSAAPGQHSISDWAMNRLVRSLQPTLDVPPSQGLLSSSRAPTSDSPIVVYSENSRISSSLSQPLSAILTRHGKVQIEELPDTDPLSTNISILSTDSLSTTTTTTTHDNDKKQLIRSKENSKSSTKTSSRLSNIRRKIKDIF